MRILLDECVPHKLDRELTPHFVSTVPREGLQHEDDDVLLKAAAAQFDVFITVDRNLSFEQNLGQLPIPVIILHGVTNRLADLKPLVPELRQVVNHLPGKQVIHVPKP
jgi:predicted nuclease of predicted toxin-antitoxin system